MWAPPWTTPSSRALLVTLSGRTSSTSSSSAQVFYFFGVFLSFASVHLCTCTWLDFTQMWFCKDLNPTLKHRHKNNHQLLLALCKWIIQETEQVCQWFRKRIKNKFSFKGTLALSLPCVKKKKSLSSIQTPILMHQSNSLLIDCCCGCFMVDCPTLKIKTNMHLPFSTSELKIYIPDLKSLVRAANCSSEKITWKETLDLII